MNSEVDTSILNSVNIKRFTKSVLEEYGAEIDRSNSAKWEVTFPEELATELDREEGTLVFDPADRELGAGDLLVQPGTTVFSALLELVQQANSVGRLELTEDTLQVNPPSVLEESKLEVAVADFTGRTSDFALAFHFRVQFETPASFHSEEMFTVTVDPETQTRLPDLTSRLTSHLPQLLQQNNEHPPQDVSEGQVRASFEEAQQAVIDRSRPIVADLQEEADESATEQIEEISDWYDQRRKELDNQIEEQREEIQKWRKKRRKARKDSTRRRYIQNRKEAEEELKQLKEEIREKKQELAQEESEEIDEVIDRNEIDVEVSLLGVTEITYYRGTLSLEVSNDHTDTVVELSYLPATDEFRGLNCEVCSKDLTDGVLPRLCSNGHVVGDPCATSCRTCDLTFCDECEIGAAFAECTVCWEDVCESCVKACESCDGSICSDHTAVCDICETTTCHLCGEGCSTCGTFHCDWHLTRCKACDQYHCREHTETCDRCSDVRCDADITRCEDCGDWLCGSHSIACNNCGETLCGDHIEFCSMCEAESDKKPEGFCGRHVITCSVGGEVVCSTHREPSTIGSAYVCLDHYDSCRTCTINYSVDALHDGRCTACRSVGEADQSIVPVELAEEFRSVEVGANPAYMVILGKKLLGRNKIIVYDREAREEIDRQNAGMLNQLLGKYG